MLRLHDIWFYALLIVAIGTIVSCNNNEPVRNIDEDELIEDFLLQDSLLDSTNRDESGIYYRILVENPAGPSPVTDNVVSFFYEAQIGNGTPFESNINDGINLPTRIHHFTNTVIPIGLDDCISILREGETGVFYIPPSLAYGGLEGFSPAIAVDSILQMTIELIEVQTEAEVLTQQRDSIDQFILDENLNDSIWAAIDTVMRPVDSLWVPNINLSYDSVMVPIDSIWYDVTNGEIPVDSIFLYIDFVEFLPAQGIYYQVLDTGMVGTSPISGEVVSIRYQLYTLESYPNNPIDATGAGTFDFFYNEDIVINGLDGGVSVMEYNERSLLILPSNTAYQGSVFVIPASEKGYFVDRELIPSYSLSVDPFDVLVFDLTLIAPPN